MFKPEKEYIREMAELAVLKGVNVQKGQPLYINASPETCELARECAKVAYEAGAKRVYIEYNDEILSRLSFENCDTDTLCKVPQWQLDKRQYAIDEKYCSLYIANDDPDLLKGIDPSKISAVSAARGKAFQKFYYYSMNNVGQWSIIAYPNPKWAMKVFPEMSEDEAMQALWQAILMTSRIELGKTVDNWNKHNDEIQKHAKLMNEYNFKELRFKNCVGTDLTVGLIKDHIWAGGSERAIGDYKVGFHPNIPTEELFTMPDRRRINGRVVSTKPLSYNCVIIPEFALTFKDGEIVDIEAKENKKILEDLVAMDKGTKSLGEVALISYDSPIQNSGILFFDTLFDENASCHLAIGACYPTNVKGGTDMSSEQLYELGGNDSMEHVDFMFGSKDLSVIGVQYDGTQIEVFKDGNFVI